MDGYMGYCGFIFVLLLVSVSEVLASEMEILGAH